jgi:hypothetical protein
MPESRTRRREDPGPAFLDRHESDPLENMSRFRLLGRKRRLRVTNDPVDDRVPGSMFTAAWMYLSAR